MILVTGHGNRYLAGGWEIASSSSFGRRLRRGLITVRLRLGRGPLTFTDGMLGLPCWQSAANRLNFYLQIN
jgi:hypothetical protein